MHKKTIDRIKAGTVIAFLFCFFSISGQTVKRFIFLSDTHFSAPADDLKTTLIYEFCMEAIDKEADFIFLAGDLAISGFADPELEEARLGNWRYLMDTLQHHGIRLFACRGNNDVSAGAAWDTLFSAEYRFPENGPEGEQNRTYAIEYDNLLFISLDHYTNYCQVNQPWLDMILSGCTQEHIFVSGHTSAFKVAKTNTLVTYPEKRDSLWESLTTAGAKAYLCGHAHFFDHARIEDGDEDPDNDLHQYIVGTGRDSFIADGAYDGDNGRWTPQRIWHEEAVGYLLAEIDGSDVTLTWKKRSGAFNFVNGDDIYRFSPEGNTDYVPIHSRTEINIFPNPAGDHLKIVLNTDEASPVSVQLLDVSGRIIHHRKITPDQDAFTLDLSSEINGIYILRVGYRDRSELHRCVILK